MTITLYKNFSDKRNLNKNLTEIKTVSATAKGDINIISPTLIIQYFSTDFNYCYISDGRDGYWSSSSLEQYLYDGEKPEKTNNDVTINKNNFFMTSL